MEHLSFTYYRNIRLNQLQKTSLDNNVELLRVAISTNRIKVNVTVAFRPPSQYTDREMYSALLTNIDSKETIIPDFNLPKNCWQTLLGVEAKTHRMLELVENNFL